MEGRARRARPDTYSTLAIAVTSQAESHIHDATRHAATGSSGRGRGRGEREATAMPPLALAPRMHAHTHTTQTHPVHTDYHRPTAVRFRSPLRSV